jgi:hypothetical protein
MLIAKQAKHNSSWHFARLNPVRLFDLSNGSGSAIGKDTLLPVEPSIIATRSRHDSTMEFAW